MCAGYRDSDSCPASVTLALYLVRAREEQKRLDRVARTVLTVTGVEGERWPAAAIFPGIDPARNPICRRTGTLKHPQGLGLALRAVSCSRLCRALMHLPGRRATIGGQGTISELPVTTQYIAGEFSALLAELEPTAGARLRGLVGNLRQEVESSPLPLLPRLAREALILADDACWLALEQGDACGFCRCPETASELQEFSASANLLH
jgi:hypothetical protein